MLRVNLFKASSVEAFAPGSAFTHLGVYWLCRLPWCGTITTLRSLVLKHGLVGGILHGLRKRIEFPFLLQVTL